jgi:Dihydrodipicolinate reductase
VEENVSRLISFGKSVVIGTTGWDHTRLSQQKEVGILHASNFSLGIHLFTALLKKATEKLGPHYKVALHEEHHERKIDAPSGTAKQLLQVLPESCPVTSLRVGSIIGFHEAIFDSPFDQIRLSHEAKSRDIFAHGALKAAEWLHCKKGTFTLEDMIHDLI